MKKTKILLLGLLLSFHVFSQETGGPYTSDENTILLMHFNNDLSLQGTYSGNIANWGSAISYESSLTGFDESYRFSIIIALVQVCIVWI